MAKYIWNKMNKDYVRQSYSKYSRVVRDYKSEVKQNTNVSRGCFFFYLVENYPHEKDLLDSKKEFGRRISLSMYYRARKFVREVTAWKKENDSYIKYI